MPDTFVKIASVTVGSGGASSMAFTSIPSTYTDLAVKVSGRTDRAAELDDILDVRPNGSTSNRTFINLRGSGTAALSSAVNRTYLNGSTSTSNTFGSVDLYLPNYASANYKSISIDSAMENNATDAFCSFVAMLWSDTTAISSLTLAPLFGSNFVQYSTATLYGIKNS